VAQASVVRTDARERSMALTIAYNFGLDLKMHFARQRQNISEYFTTRLLSNFASELA